MQADDPRLALTSLRYDPHENILSALQRIDRWLRDRSLALMALTMFAAFSWPQVASRIFGSGRAIAATTSHRALDLRTLALAAIILAVSIRCRPSDFTRAFRSRAGLASLVTIYLAVPVATAVVALTTLRLAGPDDLRGLGVGLVLIVAMPVATTAAVWTRASGGSVPVALGAIAVTSLLAALVVPQVLMRAVTLSGALLTSSIDALQAEVIIGFAIPLAVGVALRKGAPIVVRVLDPGLSIMSKLVVLAFVADTAAALRPQLLQHRDIVAIAIPLTVLTNVVAVGAGYIVARAHRLDNDETLAVMLGGGMRSVPSAVAIAALCFPGSPIVALPAIVWSITQQLLGGLLAGISTREQRRRESLEPILLLRRVKRAPSPVFSDQPKPSDEAEIEATSLRPFGVAEVTELDRTIVRPFCDRARLPKRAGRRMPR